MPTNFLRHYYDLSQLLDHPYVQQFIGTEQYHERKEVRFRGGDNLDITKNEAFLLSDPEVKKQYTEAFVLTESLYYAGQPSFDDVLEKIHSYIDRL